VPEKPVPPVRRLRIAVAISLSLAVLVLLVLVALYAARRQIAREAVTDWLRSRGVASRSEFQELGPGHLVGRLQLGPPNDPDLSVEQAEISYSLAGLLAGKGVQVTDIRLVRPALRAQWRGGRFSAGALDPLIEEYRKRPPTPGAPSPRIRIEGGALKLVTDYGVLNARLDAELAEGRLVSLEARTAPEAVKVGDVAADVGPGEVSVRRDGGRLRLRASVPFATARAAGAIAKDGRLIADAEVSYPEFAAGQISAGRVSAAVSANAVELQGARARGLRLEVGSTDLRWTRAGGDRIAGALAGRVAAQAVTAADLSLSEPQSTFDGDVAAGQAFALRLAARGAAAGSWSGLGAPAKGDSAEIVAVKRGLRAFRISVEGASVAADAKGVAARLTGPARLRPEAGGEVAVTPAGGGYRLTAAGGGLPRVAANVRRLTVANGGAVADGDLTAALSLGPLEGLEIATAGALRIAGGAASFTASRCAAAKVAHVELGANDVEEVTGRLCPDREPLFRLGAGGWTLAARAEQMAADVPFLQAALAEGAGQVRMADAKGRLSANVAIGHARIADAAKDLRFQPLQMSGHAGLAGDLWTAGLDFATPAGVALAHADLRHQGQSGVGGMEIATPELRFAPGGFQPVALSPLAKPLGEGVAGAARFTGRFQWAKDQASSGGELEISGLDFKSPLGPASGLSGRVAFSSLAPLIAPPGQRLRMERLAAALPLTDLSASLSLSQTGLLVASGEATGGGGRLRIVDLSVPFDPKAPIAGALLLDGVQLHDLVEASPFADRVDLDARVSGRIPFEAQGGKVHIAGGELHAVAPGRLSISRTALTSVAAEGSVQAPAQADGQIASSDTFTDFAYQALENLAFDKLDAAVATRADGRLGVMFHITGYHDPPKPQEITLTWMDVILRRFVGRKLPLPSGTAVDLTLDTTLNLDDLLADWSDFTRLRSSPTVQP
jgi:hypothetical protein